MAGAGGGDRGGVSILVWVAGGGGRWSVESAVSATRGVACGLYSGGAEFLLIRRLSVILQRWKEDQPSDPRNGLRAHPFLLGHQPKFAPPIPLLFSWEDFSGKTSNFIQTLLHGQNYY
jgi:hypothetical protein